MGNTAARGELLLGLVDVSKQLELVDEPLVGRDVHENRCTAPVLRQEDRPALALDVTNDAGHIGSELGERSNVLAGSRLRH